MKSCRVGNRTQNMTDKQCKIVLTDFGTATHLVPDPSDRLAWRDCSSVVPMHNKGGLQTRLMTHDMAYGVRHKHFRHKICLRPVMHLYRIGCLLAFGTQTWTIFRPMVRMSISLSRILSDGSTVLHPELDQLWVTSEQFSCSLLGLSLEPTIFRLISRNCTWA